MGITITPYSVERFNARRQVYCLRIRRNPFRVDNIPQLNDHFLKGNIGRPLADARTDWWREYRSASRGRHSTTRKPGSVSPVGEIRA